MINWNLKKIFAPAFAKEKKEGAVFENDVPFAKHRLITQEFDTFDTYPNKLRIILCAVIFVLLIFIQEAFFNGLRVFGVKPSLAVVMIFIFAFLTDFRPVILFSVFSGLYVDIVYGRFIGFYALLLMYAGVFAALISKIPGKEKEDHKGSRGFMYCTAPLFFLVYTVCESFFAKLMMMYTNSSSEFFVDYGEHFLVRILPVAAYDFVVFAVLVWPIVAVWKKTGKKKMM